MTRQDQHDQHPGTARAGVAPCPYCGHVQPQRDACIACRGLFEPLSRQATQQAMGPWRVRDDAQPFLPGCSYAIIRSLVAKGRIGADTVLRGPTTRQFWAFARDTPGVAHLLGECHQCHAPAKPADRVCNVCRASFAVPNDRQSLGLNVSDPVAAHAPAHVGNGVPTTPRPDRPAPTSQALPFTRNPGVETPRAHRGKSTNLLVLVSVSALCIALIAWGVSNLPAPGDNDARPRAVESSDPPPASRDAAPARPSDAAPTPDGAESPAQTRVRVRLGALLEDLDESDLDAVRAAVEALQALRATLPEGESSPLLNAEIERLERRIDELVLRRFL